MLGEERSKEISRNSSEATEVNQFAADVLDGYRPGLVFATVVAAVGAVVAIVGLVLERRAAGGGDDDTTEEFVAGEDQPELAGAA